MTFLFPWAAWFLAGVPVLVGLYMLRQRRRRIVVPSVMRWRAVPVAAPSRMALGRVRGWRSLLLNLLIFLLILLALMRPDFSSLLVPEPTVVVLDTRLRMRAAGGDGRTVFERARGAAEQIAARAGERNPVAVLTTSGGVSPLTADARRAGEAVAEAGVTDAGGSIEAALDLSRDVLADGEGRIVFVTDRAVEIPGVEVVAVGERADNAAITDFAVRPLPDGGQSRELFVRVRNFSDEPLTRDLEIRLDDRPLDVVPLTIPGGGSRESVKIFGSRELESERGWLTGRLVGGDALAADDVGRAAVPVGGMPRVLLVSAGNWFLENALSSDPEIAFELLTPDALRPGMELSFDAVVFDDFVPEGMSREAAAESGNFLFVGRSPWTTGDTGISNPVITDSVGDSPLLAGLSLDGAIITEAEPVVGLTSVARSVDDVLIGTRDEGRTRTATFGFRVEESDLPLKVAFPLLMANTVHWLAGVREPESLRAGELSAGSAGDVAGKTFERAGFYRDGAEDWLAVNPAGGTESDLRESGANGFEVGARRLGAAPWKWLVAVALALLAVEWVAWARRWLR